MICLMAAILSACSMTPEEQAPEALAQNAQAQTLPRQNTVHYHTQRLAHQLFRSVLTLEPNAGIAIGTFTEVDTLKLNHATSHPLRLLGLQLEEGFMTASINKGLKVIDYKTRQKLLIQSNQDLMLSRDVGALSNKQNIQYFLTGTLTEQETGVVVNARLIDTRNNQVIAAATDYVPLDTLWSNQKVQLKNDLIYRTGY